MNECINYYELIQKELDNELTSEEFLLLEKHCSNCLTCQKERKELWDIKNNLENLPLLDPGENFANSILQSIKNNHVPKSNLDESIIATTAAFCTLFFILGMSFIALLLILSLALPFISLYNTWIGTVFANISYWLSYFFNILLEIKDVSSFFTTSLVTLLLMSLFSFILLIVLMNSRRNISYENQ